MFSMNIIYEYVCLLIEMAQSPLSNIDIGWYLIKFSKKIWKKFQPNIKTNLLIDILCKSYLHAYGAKCVHRNKLSSASPLLTFLWVFATFLID